MLLLSGKQVLFLCVLYSIVFFKVEELGAQRVDNRLLPTWKYWESLETKRKEGIVRCGHGQAKSKSKIELAHTCAQKTKVFYFIQFQAEYTAPSI
jgi:hypothetical protein